MSQIEVSKLAQFSVIGPPAGNVTVSKTVMHALLIPGESESGDGTPTRQGYVYAQKIAR